LVWRRNQKIRSRRSRADVLRPPGCRARSCSDEGGQADVQRRGSTLTRCGATYAVAIGRENVGRGYVQLVPSRQPPSLPQGDGPSKRGEPRADHSRASAASRIPCRGGVAVARAVRPGRARASWSNDVHGTSQNMNVSMAMCRSVAVRPILPRNAFGHDPPDGPQVERIISADWRTRLLSWEECRRVWTRCELRGRSHAEAVGGDWTGTTPHATKPPKLARATRHDTSDRSRIPRSARYRA